MAETNSGRGGSCGFPATKSEMPGAPCRSDHLDWVKTRMSGDMLSSNSAVWLEIGALVTQSSLARPLGPGLGAGVHLGRAHCFPLPRDRWRKGPYDSPAPIGN